MCVLRGLGLPQEHLLCSVLVLKPSVRPQLEGCSRYTLAQLHSVPQNTIATMPLSIHNGYEKKFLCSCLSPKNNQFKVRLKKKYLEHLLASLDEGEYITIHLWEPTHVWLGASYFTDHLTGTRSGQWCLEALCGWGWGPGTLHLCMFSSFLLTTFSRTLCNPRSNVFKIYLHPCIRTLMMRFQAASGLCCGRSLSASHLPPNFILNSFHSVPNMVFIFVLIIIIISQPREKAEWDRTLERRLRILDEKLWDWSLLPAHTG